MSKTKLLLLSLYISPMVAANITNSNKTKIKIDYVLRQWVECLAVMGINQVGDIGRSRSSSMSGYDSDSESSNKSYVFIRAFKAK